MNKGLEALKRITLKDFILNDDSSLNDIKLIEKELKALDIIVNIIKEHHVTAYFLERTITQEEYDLLKEVLL